MRLFIALKTTPFESELLEIIKGYKKNISGVRWVESNNLHITLKFLGEVQEEMLDKVKAIIQPIAQKSNKFDFSISGVSGFPSSNSARVLFFEIEEAYEQISRLMEILSNMLLHLGFEEEKSYIPHITFARAKQTPINLNKIQFSKFKILSKALGVLIIKSDLTKGEPIYSVLSEFDFLDK